MSAEYAPILFFVIAFLYSSVGFGGGSSYLAILSLLLSQFYEIRSIALLLNLVVVFIGTLLFIRKRIFNFYEFIPFLLSGTIFAFLGAQISLSERTFFLTLASLLIVSGLLLLMKYVPRKTSSRENQLRPFQEWTLGGFIGLLSGVSGIGGGIFLSPILNLISWKNPRKVASLSSMFILVNSFAGLLGLLYAGTFQMNFSVLLPLLLAVIFGALLGSYSNHQLLSQKTIVILTAMLVEYVGLRLVLQHGFGISI